MSSDSTFSPLVELLKETVRLNAISIATFPGSLFFFFVVFSVDTVLGNTNAKAMFILGLVTLVVIMYAVGTLLFPARLGEEVSSLGPGASLFEGADLSLIKSALPYAQYTRVSIFGCIVGYLVAYWANLNFLMKTSNYETLVLVYLAIAFVFVLFETYVLGEEWMSLAISMSFGVIFGILWSILSNENVVTESDTTTNETKHGTVTRTCQGGGQNEDMVCRAFRL